MSDEPRPESNILRILLIEDDEDHATIVLRSLLKGPHESFAERVNDGIEGLAYLRRQREYADKVLPDLVLLDLKLPKLDGHDVLAAIKHDSALSNLPVIILTTSDANADISLAYMHRANSYLVKPVDGLAFRAMIENLREYWGKWNRFPGHALAEVATL